VVVDHYTNWELGRRTQALLQPIVYAAASKGLSYQNAWLRCRAYLLRLYAEYYGLRQDVPEAMIDCNFGAASDTGANMPGQAMNKAENTLSRSIHIGGVHFTVWKSGGVLELQDPESPKTGDQTLREVCAEAHSRGLKVYLWHNASGFYTGLHEVHPEWVIYDEYGSPQMSYGSPVLGIHTGWAQCTLDWFVAHGRKTLGDEGIDGIFIDSAANDGASRIDYASGEVLLPHWIKWLSDLSQGGVEVVTEMPQAFGLGNFITDNPKYPQICYLAFNNVLGQGLGPDPEMWENIGGNWILTGNEHAPMYLVRVRGCYYDGTDTAILQRENANFNAIMDTLGRRPDYIEERSEVDPCGLHDVQWNYLCEDGNAIWRRNDDLEMDTGVMPCADYDSDTKVSFTDYAAFVASRSLGFAGEHNKADLNCDGVVDFKDLAKFSEQWLCGCPYTL